MKRAIKNTRLLAAKAYFIFPGLLPFFYGVIRFKKG
jgi:hypothetical protein